MLVNPFAVPGAARLYARHRPDLSAPVVEILRRALPPCVALAADVGCGTGQSARALRALADRVLGIDAVPEMLEEAAPEPGVEYRLGEAEALPLADGECGLVAVGFALHWFGRDGFLAEARRVLAPGGVLAAWNGGMAGKGEPGPEAWRWVDRFHADFPKPDRDRRGIDDEAARAAGFAPLLRDRFAATVECDVDSFLGVLSTQSNLLVRAPAGGESLGPVLDSLRGQVAGFFPAGRSRWRMEGWVAAFRRAT